MTGINYGSNPIKEIYYSEGNEGRDTQGPAPDGFHVPTNTEWQAVYDAGVALGQWSSRNGDGMSIKLKLPFAGYRYRSTSNVNYQGSYGHYWSSTAYSADIANNLLFSSSSLYPQDGNNRAYGFSVRCFRNSPLQPSSSWTTIYAGSNGSGIYHNASEGVISISSDGQTWMTIADKNLGATTVYNDGDELSEANCGKYYQWGNNYGFAWTGTVTTSSAKVDASSYGPGNYYSSNTFITASSSPYDWSSVRNDNLWGGVTKGKGTTELVPIKEVYYGNTKIRPNSPAIEKGVYRNEALGLISVSTDGENWITIADRNLGATEVYNYGDTYTASNCGNLYQWGNNYGFSRDGGFTTSKTRVDASGYGPGNYYNSSTFILYGGNRSTVNNINLRGGAGTVEERKGPCPSGFHIAIEEERRDLISKVNEFIDSTTTSDRLIGYQNLLKLPKGGHFSTTNSGYSKSSNRTFLWYSTSSTTDRGENIEFSTELDFDDSSFKASALTIRPFKNVAVQPDDSWVRLSSGYTPTSNTIAYYPLTSTTTTRDMKTSGTKYNLSTPTDVLFTVSDVQYGTYNGVNCAYLNGNTFLTNTSLSFGSYPTYTVSIWFYVSSASSSTYQAIYVIGHSHSTGMLGTWFRYGTGLSLSSWRGGYESVKAGNINGQWHLLTNVINGSSSIQYIDGVLYQSYTNSLSSTQSYLSLGLPYGYGTTDADRLTGYLSECIVENKARTEAEITDYYNKTKSDYGL